MIGESDVDEIVCQAVRRCEMFDVIGCRFELIHPAPGANIDAAPLVFRKARRLVASQTFGSSQTNKARIFRRGVVNAAHPGLSCRYPKPAGMIQIEIANETERDSIGRAKEGKLAITIPHQPAIVWRHPEIAGATFAKGSRGSLRPWIDLRIAFNAAARAVPARQIRSGREDAQPDVAVRVFEQAEHLRAFL